MEVAPGVTLDEAWKDLSQETRTLIVDEVTKYIIDAVRYKSPSIYTILRIGIIYHGIILRFREIEKKGIRN